MEDPRAVSTHVFEEVADYVNIVGPIKDMIIRGGENIYPREVEEFSTHTLRLPTCRSSVFRTSASARRSVPG